MSLTKRIYELMNGGSITLLSKGSRDLYLTFNSNSWELNIYNHKEDEYTDTLSISEATAIRLLDELEVSKYERTI